MWNQRDVREVRREHIGEVGKGGALATLTRSPGIRVGAREMANWEECRDDWEGVFDCEVVFAFELSRLLIINRLPKELSEDDPARFMSLFKFDTSRLPKLLPDVLR